jgi:hypothetical protein
MLPWTVLHNFVMHCTQNNNFEIVDAASESSSMSMRTLTSADAGLGGSRQRGRFVSSPFFDGHEARETSTDRAESVWFEKRGRGRPAKTIYRGGRSTSAPFTTTVPAAPPSEMHVQNEQSDVSVDDINEQGSLWVDVPDELAQVAPARREPRPSSSRDPMRFWTHGPEEGISRFYFYLINFI